MVESARCIAENCKSPSYKKELCVAHNSELKAARERGIKPAFRVYPKPTDDGDRVYAIFGAGKVKIGFTSCVRRRFSAIKTSSPVHLELMGAALGNRLLEGRLHGFLDAYRSHGEWFDYEGLVVDVVDFIKSGKTDELLDFIVERENELPTPS